MDRKPRHILTIAAAVFLATPALAQNWVDYSRTDDVAFSYAPDTIRRIGKVVRVWDRTLRPSHRNSFGEIEDETRVLWEFDCRDESYQMLAFASYNEGKVVHSGSFPRSTPSYPSPGGAGERLMKLVCR